MAPPLCALMRVHRLWPLHSARVSVSPVHRLWPSHSALELQFRKAWNNLPIFQGLERVPLLALASYKCIGRVPETLHA